MVAKPSADSEFRSTAQKAYECIKRRVLASLTSNPYCAGSAAKDSMEAVWDVCYNDTAPFDRAP